MIGTVYILAGIMIVFGLLHVHLLRRYVRTKEKPSLYLGMAALFYIFPAAFGVLIAVATAMNNLYLATIFYQFSTTFGILAYVFLNLFAIAVARPGEEKQKVWVPLASFFIITLIVWVSNPVAEGTIDSTTEFTLTSMYKPPYGLPLVETILVLMTIMGAYPIYLFLYTAKTTKEKAIKVKSFFMGIGLFIAAIAYAIEVTDAISYVYMPIYRPMIFVGAFFLCFGYLMPRRIEKMIVGNVLTSYDSVESIMEKFLASTVTPKTHGNPHTFSKALGIKHQQMVGRKILFEFDPASSYEKPVRDFIDEALTNQEQAFVFTRKGSAIHSSLSGLEGVKFFCMTQQTSVPKELSENEVLLPSNDVSLMLNVFDKMLKTQQGNIVNIVFDNLSDIILSTGFEKAYQFVKYATEILASPKVTVIFLLNKVAHDIKVISSLQSLFSDQISLGKEGLQTIKLMEKGFTTVHLEGETVKEVGL